MNTNELVDVFGISETFLYEEDSLIVYRGDISINPYTSIRARQYKKTLDDYRFHKVYGNFRIIGIDKPKLPDICKTLTFIGYEFENLEFLKHSNSIEIVFNDCVIKPDLSDIPRNLKSLRFKNCRIYDTSNSPENLDIMNIEYSEVLKGSGLSGNVNYNSSVFDCVVDDMVYKHTLDLRVQEHFDRLLYGE